MEGNDKLDRLILSYLLGELNGSEEAFVKEQIESDELVRWRFEELKMMLELIQTKDTYERVDLENEWRNFEQNRLNKQHPVIYLDQAERFGQEVIKEVKLKRKTSIFRAISVTVAAASVILAIVLGWNHVQQEKTFVQQADRTEQQPVQELVELTRRPVARLLTNYSGATKTFTLQDGTVVKLFDNSELSFMEPFETNRRDIRLTGSANFTVAKDKERPFTVFSGSISTTAIGTCFTVTAYRNEPQIKVALHEGKVVVRNIACTDNNKTLGYYLSAGQELIFDKTRPGARPSIINAEGATIKGKQLGQDQEQFDPAIDQPSMPKFGKGSWFMFNNQPLDVVLDQLAEMYKVEIRYNKADIARIYFIGTFGKAESVESVLSQIATLNGLVVKKESTGFAIGK